MEKTIKITPPEGYEVDKEKSTFDKIIFKKIENSFPMSWEELERVKGYYVSSDSDMLYCTYYPTREATRNIFPSMEEAKAMLAMAQLCQLRDRWNDGWKADWEDGTVKYCIGSFKNILRGYLYYDTCTPMAFKSKELRDKFMETFKDLLEEAKPFL